MTKEKLRRYFELDRDLADSGRLDPGGRSDGPRWLEYRRLADEFDAWEPEPDPEPLELRVNCLEQGLVVVAKLVELLDDAMRAHIRSRSD